jgi:hypothetical protein
MWMVGSAYFLVFGVWVIVKFGVTCLPEHFGEDLSLVLDLQLSIILL